MESFALPCFLVNKDVGKLVLSLLPWPQHLLWLQQVGANRQLAELIDSCDAFMALRLAKLGYFDTCAFLTRRKALYQSSIDNEEWLSILQTCPTDVVDFLLTCWISDVTAPRNHFIVTQAIGSVPLHNLKIICTKWTASPRLMHKFMKIAVATSCLERVQVVAQMFPSTVAPTNNLEMQQYEFAVKLRYVSNIFGYFDVSLPSTKQRAVFCQILNKGYYELASNVWHSYSALPLSEFIVLHPFPIRTYALSTKQGQGNDAKILFAEPMIIQTKTKHQDCRYFNHLIQFFGKQDSCETELHRAIKVLLQNIATSWSEQKLQQLLYSCVIDNCCASVAYLTKQCHLTLCPPFLVTNKEMLELIWTIAPSVIQDQVVEFAQHALSVCSDELWEFLCDKRLLDVFFDNDPNAFILDFVANNAAPLSAKTWQQYSICIRQQHLEPLLLHSSQYIKNVLDAQEEVYASDAFCEVYCQYLYDIHMDNQLIHWLKRIKQQNTNFLQAIEFYPKRLCKFWFALKPDMQKILARTVNLSVDQAIFFLEQRVISPKDLLTYLRQNKKKGQDIFDIFASIHFDVDGEAWHDVI